MLIFFDCESTGPDASGDRITEVAIVREGESPRSWLVNPERPIPPAIADLTGITDELVAYAPNFAAVAAEVADSLTGGTLVGFGCHSFDIPLLAAEFERAGVPFDWPECIDVGALYKIARPRSLGAAVAEYCGRDHGGAHRAEADALATRDVFAGLLAAHPELPGSPYELAIRSRYGKRFADPANRLAWIDGRLCFNFGKHTGKRVLQDFETRRYAEWILGADFPDATKRMLERELTPAEAGR
jgi:DNA polymerase-3 subunit epsilon